MPPPSYPSGIVSNDMQFLNHILGNTISGTIYAGIRARTTAAPQQVPSATSPYLASPSLPLPHTPLPSLALPPPPSHALPSASPSTQHWFGPSGDPRSGGIHTPEAIKLCWSSHREIIYDHGPVAPTWAGKTS